MSIFLYIYMGRGEILATYHWLYIVEIFVGLVMLTGLLEIYKIVIKRT